MPEPHQVPPLNVEESCLNLHHLSKGETENPMTGAQSHHLHLQPEFFGHYPQLIE